MLTGFCAWPGLGRWGCRRTAASCARFQVLQGPLQAARSSLPRGLQPSSRHLSFYHPLLSEPLPPPLQQVQILTHRCGSAGRRQYE